MLYVGISTYQFVVLKWYENVCVCVRVCVCVCVCVGVYVCVRVDGMNFKYALRCHTHTSVHSVLCQCYTQARAHTPFEDSEPTGLKVDIALESFLRHLSVCEP